MNIFLKAENERIYSAPFQYEQFKGVEQNLVYKLIIDTVHTDLPFHQILFTLPYSNMFEEVLNLDSSVYMQQMIIDIVHPELCVNTFRQGEFLGSQFIEILTGQYMLPEQINCNKQKVAVF